MVVHWRVQVDYSLDPTAEQHHALGWLGREEHKARPLDPLRPENNQRNDFNSSIPQDGMQSVALFYTRSRWFDLHRVTPGVRQPAQKTVCRWATWSPGTA